MASKYASKEVIPLANVKDVSVQGDGEIVEKPLNNLVGIKFTVSSRRKCEEIIYCYSVILLLLVKIGKANVEIIYSLV